MVTKRSAKRTYRIYSLYDANRKIAFLGKSYAKNLAPTYSKHLCGKNIYTNQHFGKVAPLVVPQLCILETVIGTYRDAYRHLVAWCRYFMDAGFDMLLQDGTVSYATSLLPETKEIYNTIRTTPLEIVLEQGSCIPTKIALKKPTQHPASGRKNPSVQFNLRVFEHDMLEFLQFCEKQHLTRKEGFSLLLNSSPFINDDYASYTIEEIQKLNASLVAQTMATRATQEKLEKLTLEIQNDTRYHTLRSSVQALLRDYFELVCLHVDEQSLEPLKICSYNSFQNIQKYVYPQAEQGIQIITLKGLVYGRCRTPAVFILAENENNQMLRFRTYPRKDYIGIPIPRSNWTFFGSKWLVTWKRASDGAMELVGSMPVSHAFDTLSFDDAAKDHVANTSTLDALIQRAQARSKL